MHFRDGLLCGGVAELFVFVDQRAVFGRQSGERVSPYSLCFGNRFLAGEHAIHDAAHFGRHIIAHRLVHAHQPAAEAAEQALQFGRRGFAAEQVALETFGKLFMPFALIV